MESGVPEPSGASRGKRIMQVGGALFMGVGVIAGLFLLPAEWSWVRRALGGLVIGAGTALMVFGWRLLVYDGDDA
jgi:hypothetical protein